MGNANISRVLRKTGQTRDWEGFIREKEAKCQRVENHTSSGSESHCHVWFFGTPWTIQSYIVLYSTIQTIQSPGQNTGVGSLSLLQQIFPIQGLNPGLPHCRQILYHLSHKQSPGMKMKQVMLNLEHSGIFCGLKVAYGKQEDQEEKCPIYQK